MTDFGGIAIRPAARADLDALIALYLDDELGRRRETAGGADRRLYENGFDRVAADASTEVHVAVWNGTIVGTFQLTITPGVSRRGVVRATIESVRTRSDLRGKGIGGAMMRAAIEEARRRGADVVQLTSDLSRQGAHRFYARLGFVHSHAGFKLDLRRD